MASEETIIYFGMGSGSLPSLLTRFGEARGLSLLRVSDLEELHALVNRGFPACLVLDASDDPEGTLEVCRSFKDDAFTAIVPLVLHTPEVSAELPARGLEAGADEVITGETPEREKSLRMELVLRRATRDVSVHPTTRLPGTIQIERDMGERIASGRAFSVCYADLDHFKEFNDRYGYNQGDRVIFLLSKILRDLVRGLAPGGFVGHIGGDDFVFNVDLEHLEVCCDEIIRLFDELIPFQYTEEDRKAGYFLGKDRRGNIHRIPLMSLSIGVVTNHRNHFTHTAQVTELLAEMKSFAKSLPGSVYVVDRRQNTSRPDEAEGENMIEEAPVGGGPASSPPDDGSPPTSAPL